MTRETATDVDAQAALERLPLQQCALALSGVLALFAAWAWLAAGGVWAGELTQLTPGFVVLAALSFVVQLASNVAAAAARQAHALGLKGDMARAQTLMILGGAYNAVSIHHALEMVGFLAGDWAALSWLLAAVLAFYEPAQWWVDSSLKVAVASAEARAEAARLARANAIDRASMERRRESASPARESTPARPPRANGTDVVTPAQVKALADRYRHERRWRDKVAAELGISVRTVTRYLSRAQEGAPSVERQARPVEAALAH